MADEHRSQQDENRVPLGAVVIPPGEVSSEEREVIAEKLYQRMLGQLPMDD